MYSVGYETTDNYAIALNYIFQDYEEVKKLNILEVAKDGSKQYTTITDAYNDAIKTCSKENPITILIYPGIYKEYVNVLGKRYLSFIGIDKKRTIWRYDDANYSHAPLRISGNCYVANITFISTADDYISDVDRNNGFSALKRDILNDHFTEGYPTWLGTMGAYAVHCDDDHNNDGELVVSTFENCIMYSETLCAFGAGLWPNSKIELLNCKLVTKFDKEIFDHVYPSIRGCLYIHGLQSNNFHGEFGEHFYAHNCVIHTNYKTVACFEKVNSETDDLDYVLLNNIFISDEISGVSKIKWDGVETNKESFGNNVTSANGDNE